MLTRRHYQALSNIILDTIINFFGKEHKMHIAILTLTFSLPGCGSLKEKRQRMGGLHTRFGNTPSVAVCESGEHDRHDASEWTFVIVGLSKREVESQCSQIEEKIERIVDARVINVEREFV
jgi:hypothetical protein